ncbi:HNH endonuclease [Spiroplasma endosymbiont of Anurida maritima]|uniref:HNH endonuclease signature motif containing protein n=1 Tax=Spiroplasma endosymbiont of Anurida maritima TaxID=2967972 RepID=UPI0036D2F21C
MENTQKNNKPKSFKKKPFIIKYEPTSDKVVWKRHPDFMHLELSSEGEVRYFDSKHKKELKKPKASNYYILRKKIDGKTKSFPFHKIMVETFIGEIPKNMTIDHVNNNPRDNRASNLEIVSKRENNVRQIRTWSNPNSFYNKDLIKAHEERHWVYNDKRYNWIEILKILHEKKIRYFQLKWIAENKKRIGLLPNGERIYRIKNLAKYLKENNEEPD